MRRSRPQQGPFSSVLHLLDDDAELVRVVQDGSNCSSRLVRLCSTVSVLVSTVSLLAMADLSNSSSNRAETVSTSFLWHDLVWMWVLGHAAAYHVR